MAGQKAKARAAWKGSGAKASEDIWFDLVEEHGATEFTGYSGDEGEGVVLAIVKDNRQVENAEIGETVEILLNQTPFYAESGGQIGDTGKLTTLKGFVGDVEDTWKPLGKLHVLRSKVVAGELTVGETVHQLVDAERRNRIRANHSATHLLHAALREQLGTHVTQKGSLVAPDYFRFDFSHPKALSRQEIEAVEAKVNAQIRSNEPVTTHLMTPEEAISEGAMALFGEKYGDEVRVLSMGREGGADYSVELCGGTHVRALGDIQLLKIISESAVSAGVRRIEALTGEAARRWLGDRDAKLREAAATLKSSPDEVPARIASLVEERRKLERELADVRKQLAMGEGSAKADSAPEEVNGHKFLGQVVEGFDPKGLRAAVDEMKKRLGSGIGALVAVNDGRASVVVGVTEDLAGQVSAVDLVKAAVATLGGQGGGGRPDMAQGGGPDGSKAKEALEAVKDALEKVAAGDARTVGGPMKTIGLLGGLSWESSAQYYAIINREVMARLGNPHSARALMLSVDFGEVENLQHSGEWDALGAMLSAEAQRLEAGGADCILLCSNTMHLRADDITAAVSIPLIHIADSTGREVCSEGLKCVGLLGTAFTMEKPFYRKRLQDEFGLEVLIPGDRERKIVHRVIYEELVCGKVLENSRTAYLDVIDRLRQRGAEGIVLGCTEIMMLIDQDHVDLRLFDTTRLHALAGVDFALS